MRRKASRVVLAAATCFFVAAPVVQALAAIPDCAGPIEVEHAHIIRTERNAALILSDGRAAHLEGIRLPLGRLDHGPQYLADEALAVLGDMADGHDLVLTAVPPKEDHYDRIRAQVFSGDTWLQAELLRRGLARVSIAPDRIECADELYGIEAKARAARAGLWALAAYAVRTPDQLGGDVGAFEIVKGEVTSVEQTNGRTVLNFAGPSHAAFIATISPDDLVNFRTIGVDPRGYEGKWVQLRGVVVRDGAALAIAIANPLEIEVQQ